jgi:RNA polymerase sigma-B factor
MAVNEYTSLTRGNSANVGRLHHIRIRPMRRELRRGTVLWIDVVLSNRRCRMTSLELPRQAGRRQDQLLLGRHHVERSEATTEALVERYLPLAQHLARRYPAGGEEEDLMQVASLGLLKAIDRYDPSRGIAFSSFAVPTILGELKRYFRDHGWSVRPPRDVQELSGQLAAATDTLTAKLRRAPTPDELARECGVSVEQVLEAHAAVTAHHPDALDRPRNEEADAQPAGGLGKEDPALAGIENTLAFESLLAVLPERERLILHLRFHEEWRQREIGEHLGLSQMHVSRLIRQSLAALQDVADPRTFLGEGS